MVAAEMQAIFVFIDHIVITQIITQCHMPAVNDIAGHLLYSLLVLQYYHASLFQEQ